MKKFTIGTVMVALAATGSAMGADLKAPFELETTKVLPKGVRNPRFKNLFMDVTEKFNGLGQVEPLGQKLNKTVTWADIVSGQKTQLEKTQVLGTMQDLGFAETDSPGRTTGQVNTFADVKVPVLAMGLTERLTLAAAIPIMRVSVSADTGFVKTGQGQQFVDDICAKDISKCNEAKAKLDNAVNQKLTTKGYDPVQSNVITGVGDLKVVGKYLLHQNDRNTYSMKTEVTLPTGIAPDADKALDVPTGDGQWDIGASLAYDHRITTDLTFNAFGGYTVQLPATLVRRLPVSATDSISEDSEALSRNLGDVINLGTSVANFFPRVGVTVGLGYTFQYLTKTTYQDGSLESFRYRLLENEYPYQAVHSGVVTAGFSTVEWFKAKKFVYPFQVNVAYSQPLIGRNVTTNSVIAGELVLFF